MLRQDEQVLAVMQERESNAMKALKTSISHIAENIDRYRKQPQHFTRKNKLPFEKLVKVRLNMQGNSLNAELQTAFPELPERMTASAYVQARDKLSLPVFEDLLVFCQADFPIFVVGIPHRHRGKIPTFSGPCQEACSTTASCRMRACSIR